MSHPWVYSFALTGDKITLRVEVTDLQTTTGAVEITGEATQINGAWARISSVTDWVDAVKGDPNKPDEKDKYFMDVEAVPTPDHSFDPNDDVTVWVRVSKAWVTVLGPGTDDPSKGAEGPIWGIYKADSQLPASAAGSNQTAS